MEPVPRSDQSNPSIQLPQSQSAASWFGDLGTKLAAAVVIGLVIGAGGWMVRIHETLIKIQTRLEPLPSYTQKMEDFDHRITVIEGDSSDQVEDSQKFYDREFLPMKRKIEAQEKRIQALESRKGR